MPETFVAEKKTVGSRTNFTLIAYLTFTREGAHKSETMRLHAQETNNRLRALLRYLRDQVDGVKSVRVYKHALGGMIPTGRGHPATQVFVEVGRLKDLDDIRKSSQRPGELHDLLEAMRERIDTCSTEIVYEFALKLDG